MTTVEYHADLKEVQSDARLSHLLSSESQSTPFDRLAWWQGLEEYCGLKPLIAIARDNDAMAVLPLKWHAGHLQALSNWYTFRFRPVITPGANSDVLLTALARSLASHTHRIVLTGLPDEDGTASALERAFRRAGWIVFREPCDINHVLELRGRSYDDYLASRPGPLRTTLKRKSGKVETEVLTRFDSQVWADYESVYSRSWKPEEGSPAFLRAFAEAEGAAGRLRLGIARAGHETVAAQMWTVEGNTAFIHKLAHTEDSKPLSPGSVLSAALFRHVIDVDHVAEIDFGTGNDSYKRDWMEETRIRYRLDILKLSAPQNWPLLVKSGLQRLAGKQNHG